MRALSSRPRPGIAFPAIVFLLTILQSACVVGSALEAAKDEPTGSARFTDPDGITTDFAPVSCVSGEQQLFLGADFADAHGQVARLVIDPLGDATLRVFAAATPLQPGLLFRRADCEQFQLSLERTGWQINEIYDVGVSLEFSCRLESGAAASGRLAAAHCH